MPNQHFSHCDISLVRYNRDKEINQHGNKFLEICRGFNLIIVNGRVGTDKRIGDLTCANASTIDYCVASPELFDAFNDFFVDVFDPLLSDKHSPVILKMANLMSYKKEVHEKSFHVSNHLKVKWNPSSAKDFLENIDE